jgi:hypothetical protein
MTLINEGLRPNDLQYLVSNYISVDQYTSKLDDDNITIAFFCNEREVAEDLQDFIEKTFYIEIRDIEIADSLTEDNKYILFVELERNINFPKILMNIIGTVNNVTNNENWVFKAFGMKEKMPLTLDNLKDHIRLSKLRDAEKIQNNEENTEEASKEAPKEENVKESFEPVYINDNGWKRKYIPQGYVSQETMEKYINESATINSRDSMELYLLEATYPDREVIVTDSKIFLIGSDNILMME